MTDDTRTGGEGADALDAYFDIGDPFEITYHDAVEEPGNLRIIRVYDDSMAPGIREGDRVVVDLSIRLPSAGRSCSGSGTNWWSDKSRRRTETGRTPASGSSPPTPTTPPPHASHGTSAVSARWCGW